MPFVRVAGVGAIPVGRGTRVEHGDLAVAVFNAGAGRFFACRAVCPHGEGPLADGRLEGAAARANGDAVEVDLP